MPVSRNLRPRTQKTYAREITRFTGYFQDCFGESPDTATEDQLRRYASEFCGRYISSSASLAIHLAAVKYWYTRIKKRTLATPLNVPDVVRNPPRILDPAELESLFAHTRHHVCGIMLRLVFASGSRLSEILRVRVQDLDFDDYRLLLRCKRENPDRYSIFAENMKYELIRMAHLKEPSDYLFTLRRTSEGQWEKVSKRTLQQYITRASRDLGLGRITVQTLRDNFAIHLLRRAVDMRKLTELMGFSSLRPIQKYKMYVPDKDIRLSSPLDNWRTSAQRETSEGLHGQKKEDGLGPGHR